MKNLGEGPWGEAIRELLNRAGVNQVDLAKVTGLTANTISRAVRGQDVNTRTLRTIADAFQDVEMTDVLVPRSRRLADEDRRQLAIEAADFALRGARRPAQAEATKIVLGRVPSQDATAEIKREVDQQEWPERTKAPVQLKKPITKPKAHKARRRR